MLDICQNWAAGSASLKMEGARCAEQRAVSGQTHPFPDIQFGHEHLPQFDITYTFHLRTSQPIQPVLIKWKAPKEKEKSASVILYWDKDILCQSLSVWRDYQGKDIRFIFLAYCGKGVGYFIH